MEITRFDRDRVFEIACRKLDKKIKGRQCFESFARAKFETACNNVEAEGNVSKYSRFSLLRQCAGYAYRCLVFEGRTYAAANTA